MVHSGCVPFFSILYFRGRARLVFHIFTPKPRCRKHIESGLCFFSLHGRPEKTNSKSKKSLIKSRSKKNLMACKLTSGGNLFINLPLWANGFAPVVHQKVGANVSGIRLQ
jgi:hypothetical protein